MFPSPDSHAQSRRSPADRPSRSLASVVRGRWAWGLLLGALVTASAIAHVLANDSGRVTGEPAFGRGPAEMPGPWMVDSSWRPVAGEPATDRAPESSPDPGGSTAANESLDARLPRSAAMRISRSPLRNTVYSASPPPVPRLQGITRRFAGVAAERRDAPRRVACRATGIRAPPGSAGPA